ncbi:MAG: response regulator [Deltaproteobacteria bacterium]|nr:response regulator [Deltaproteobacteria bacterium]
MTEFTDLLSQFEADGEAPSPDQPKVPILVVDDDPSIRRGLSRVFSHKYDVLTAECGKDAVEALTEAVHCVILDVKMKEQNAAILILAQTLSGGSADSRFWLGFDDVQQRL